MTNKVIPSLLTLPVELIYRILDQLDVLNILLSMRNVCTRINTIVDDYHRDKVEDLTNVIVFIFIIKCSQLLRSKLSANISSLKAYAI
jgi:hypothetical protein